MFWFIMWGLLTALFTTLLSLIKAGWLIILWFILSLIIALLLVVVVIYFIIIPIIFNKSKETSKFHWFMTRQCAQFFLALCNTRVKVEGEENIPDNLNILYVSNHKSLLDPVFVIYAVRRAMQIMGKIEIWQDMKYLTFLFKTVHVLKIDRNNDRKSMEEVMKGIKTLRGGKGVLVFPEGGIITRDVEQMVAIKAGAYKLATKSNATILPMAIFGDSKFDKLPIFKHKEIRVRILKPIEPNEYENLTTLELGQKVVEEVNENYDEEKWEVRHE